MRYTARSQIVPVNGGIEITKDRVQSSFEVTRMLLVRACDEPIIAGDVQI